MIIVILVLWIAIGFNCIFDWEEGIAELGKWQRVVGYAILIIGGPVFLFNSLLIYVMKFLGFKFGGNNGGKGKG